MRLGVKFFGDGRRLLGLLNVDPVGQGGPFEEFLLLLEALLDARHHLGLLVRLLLVRRRVQTSFTGIERITVLVLEAGRAAVNRFRVHRVMEVMGQVAGRRRVERRGVDAVNELGFARRRSSKGTPFGSGREARARARIVGQAASTSGTVRIEIRRFPHTLRHQGGGCGQTGLRS